jgi:hypothetical protein
VRRSQTERYWSTWLVAWEFSGEEIEVLGVVNYCTRALLSRSMFGAVGKGMGGGIQPESYATPAGWRFIVVAG